MEDILATQYCLITVVMYCLVLFPDHGETQTVQLISSPDIAIIGETFNLSCLSPDFVQNQDVVEIRFRNETLIHYLYIATIYNGRPGAYTIQSTDSGVVLTIIEVNAIDEGTYQCIVNKAGTIVSSREIYVVVKEFPRPTCFGPSEKSNSYVYSMINNDRILTTEPSINVSFVCSVNIDNSNVHVIPRWSRSDGKAISQTLPFLNTAIITLTTSLDDDGIHFVCTSQNSTYVSITKMCSIQVFVSPTFNPGLDPTISVETSTSVAETTKVEFGVFTRQIQVETSNVKLSANRTIHVTTSQASMLTDSSSTFTPTFHTFQTPMLTDPSSTFSAILAIGLGSSIAVIVLTLPTIVIILLCIIKSCKKVRSKDTQEMAYYSSRINKEGAKESSYYSSRFMEGRERPYYSSNIATSQHEMATVSSTNNNPHIYDEIHETNFS